MGADRLAVGSADGTPLAAVVEAVAARTGGPVALWGHSYGAGCAMGGAALTGAVHHLVLYEPGLGIPYPAGSIEEVEAALAAGDAETALLLVLAGIVGMTDEEIASLLLEGHAHLAHRSDPAMAAALIRSFVSGSAAASGARPGARTRPG
jgi:alpha-beta hydrolase superfamily lysophospholipase